MSIRLEINVSDCLYVALKELRASYRIKNWNDLFKILLQSNRPETYQKNYTRLYEDQSRNNLDIRLEETTIITFNTFAAVFKSKEDCLDFLVEQEKNKGMGTANLSF